MLNTQNPVQPGTYCCTLPIAIYLTDYYVTCIQRQRIFFKTPCDSGGARTLDSGIKSAVLYLLSYEVILSKNYLFVLTVAKVRIFFQTTKCFTNFFFISNVILFHHIFYYNKDLDENLNFFSQIEILYHKLDMLIITFLFAYGLSEYSF